jgi:ABC-type bacteriocin/lantibiotic exporter with double-glycine peptidase domain
MRRSLPERLTLDLLGRLRTHEPPEGWREDIRRLPLLETPAAALSDGIVEVARRAGLTLVRRSASRSDWASVLARGTAPVIVLGEDATGTIRVAVIDEIGAGTLTCRFADGDGFAAAERVEVPALFDRLVGREGIVGVLFPVVGVRPESSEEAQKAGPLERLGQLFALERGNIGLVYAYATLVGLLSLTLPLGVQAIIGLVSGGLFLQPIVLLISFVVLGTLATGALQVLQLAAVERIQQRIFARLALEFSLRVPRIRTEEAWREDLPERMNRFFEVVTIQKSLSKLLTETTTAMLQVIFGLLLLTFYHPYFTLFGLGLVVTLWIILRVTGPRGLETSLLESAYKYRAVHWLQEIARAATSFKVAGRATPSLDKMDGHVAGYLRYRQRHFAVLVTQAWAAIWFKTVVTGALLILGSVLVIDGQITLGQFVAAELVIVTVLAGIEKLVGSLADVYDTMTSVYKLGGVTDLAVEPAVGLPVATGRTGLAVQVDDLSFQYPGNERQALQGISFTAAPGERLAITGADGSGESTLLGTLAGLLVDYGGTIQFDGVTLRDLDLASIRDRIGVVRDDADLFEGTVEENIMLGRPEVRTDDVLAALATVGAADQVQRLPNGLRTPITGGGRGLPSTLRTRLLIARAIVSRPRLLLIDECLTTVEPAVRSTLIAALTDRTAPWTLLIVGHSSDILAACDRVLLLNEGRLELAAPWAEASQSPGVTALLSTGRSTR